MSTTLKALLSPGNLWDLFDFGNSSEGMIIREGVYSQTKSSGKDVHECFLVLLAIFYNSNTQL